MRCAMRELRRCKDKRRRGGEGACAWAWGGGGRGLCTVLWIVLWIVLWVDSSVASIGATHLLATPEQTAAVDECLRRPTDAQLLLHRLQREWGRGVRVSLEKSALGGASAAEWCAGLGPAADGQQRAGRTSCRWDTSEPLAHVDVC